MPIIRSLSVKVILSVVLSVAVTLAAGFSILLRHEREEFNQTMVAQTGQVAGTLLASLDHSMMENDNRRTLETMRTLVATGGVDHLMILNRRGEAALSSGAGEAGSSSEVPGGLCEGCHRPDGVRNRLVLTARNADGKEIFRHLIPILNKENCRSCHRERFLGILVSDLDASWLRAHEASQKLRFVVLAMVTFGVISLCLLAFVVLFIRRPVGELIRGTREMARGNYHVRLPDFSGDEMGALAASFNLMAEKVEESRAILEKWNVTLEEEVERRTDDLRRSNQQLEEEKHQTESITQSIVEGVLSVARDGTVILANEPVAELLGRDPAVVLGQPVADVLRFSAARFENAEQLEAFTRPVPGEPQGRPLELRQLQPRRRTWKVSRNVIRGRRNEERGWVFSFHDLTREKEIDEMKTNLVAMVSHELRTPLTAIKGSLSLLVEGKVTKEAERKEFQQVALTNTDRLIELINNLLDLSKIESGSVFYEHGAFRLEPLLRRCTEAVSGFARRNGVNIALRVEEGLDELAGDASKIEQVFINLLSNAIKFSPGGGTVTVEAASRGEDWLFSVTDQGMGIPAAEQDRIFDKFYQVDMSAVRRIGGSGLGLSIVKAIVDGHGGRVWVESAPGSGSRFLFTLPRRRAAASAVVTKPAVVPAEPIPHRVLVVEDEVSVRQVLCRYLKEKGFEVLEASNAREALDLARLKSPDCITVDVMLPDLDGLDLTAILKSDPRTSYIPIVFLTVTEGEGRARGMDLGAAAWFTKPADYHQVAEAIGGILGGEDGASGRRVLLVDDEPDVVKPLGAFLEHRGLTVDYAWSGGEALESLRRGVPDLVLLDLRMPEVSGLEVLRRMKTDARLARVPVIVVTASEEERSRREVLDLGAAAFVRKPIYPEALFREIERIIH